MHLDSYADVMWILFCWAT